MARKKKNPDPAAEENEIIQEEIVSEQQSADVETETDDNEGSFVQADSATIGIVANAVNFRTGASFNKAVIAELKPGAPVKVTATEQGENGVWYQCEYQGKTGYIKATGIKFEQ